MGSPALSPRPLLTALAAGTASLGCVLALSAAPATAKRPSPPSLSTSTMPTYTTSIVGVSPQALSKPNQAGRRPDPQPDDGPASSTSATATTSSTAAPRRSAHSTPPPVRSPKPV